MAVKTSSPRSPKPFLPPDESMWEKYSPHFEFPLASATSLFLHGTIIGMIAIGGMAFFWAAREEAAKPPRMDVVMLEGGGTGFEGLGGVAGSPGAPDAGQKQRTENIGPDTPDQPEPTPQPRAFKDTAPELDVPFIDDGMTPVDSVAFVELAKAAKDADDDMRKAMELPKSPPSTGKVAKSVGTPGTGNPRGKNGLGGPGDGPGKGNKKGPGTGTGGFGGRLATKQEIYAMRWHFDLGGDAKEHARKLTALGVTLALPDGKGGFFVITDLKRRPVEMKKESLVAYKDAVKWYNTKNDSVQLLARELQLNFVPQYVVLLLPKDREEKMAAEEARFAEANRRELRSITMTRFDFELRNGGYDPKVLQQR
jgi:hypothetical protein